MGDNRSEKYKSQDGEIDGDAQDLDDDIVGEAERLHSPRPSQLSGKPTGAGKKVVVSSGAASPKEGAPPIKFNTLQVMGAGAQSQAQEPVKEVVAFTGAPGLDNNQPSSGSSSPRAEHGAEPLGGDKKPEVSAHLVADPDYKPKKKPQEKPQEKSQEPPKKKSIFDCFTCCFPSKSAKVHPDVKPSAAAPANKRTR